MKRVIKKQLVILLTLALVVGLSAPIPTTAADSQSAIPEPEKAEILGAAAPVTVQSNPGSVGPRGNTAADPAKGIYVSPSGKDSTATGSISAPYKSINTALAAAKAGDTIILRSGTYKEGTETRIRKPNITIKSKQGEWAVIDLTNYKSGHGEDSGVYFDVDSSGGKLQSVEVIGGYYAVCMETKWDWGGPSRAGASNIIIEDCKLHDSRYDVVKVKPNCDNITIRFNEIYNSGTAYKGGEGNAEGIDNVNGDNMKAQNNYIHDICSTGIYAKGGATDALIENNRIERTNEAGILIGFDTSPELFDLKVNPQYYENIRGVARNNLIIDAGLSGIGLFAAKDAQVYNNTLVNVANGAYHSAIYFGLTYQDWKPHKGRPSSVNPNIHHNVVKQPATVKHPMIEIRYSNDIGGMSALNGDPVMNNNCYYIAGKSAVFTDNRPGSKAENMSLSAWKNHINGESGSIEADPALDASYMSTNPLCSGMGIQLSLDTPVYTPGDTGANKKYAPAKTSISKISIGKRQMTVKWKKLPTAQKVTKYQVRYRVSGSSKWTTKSFAATKSSAKIKQLKKGKKYQVQVRSYRTVSKVKHYSPWCKTKLSGRIK